MADEGRQRRVAERIREIVATTLDRKVKDPRLGFVTITDVRVTGDLQHATVYYTVMGAEDDQKKTRRALQSAKGLIRSEVGAGLGLRLTPTISFEQDALPDSAASIEEALRAARAKDAQIAAESVGKEYSGEADPYLSEEGDDANEALDTPAEEEKAEVATDLRAEIKEESVESTHAPVVDGE